MTANLFKPTLNIILLTLTMMILTGAQAQRVKRSEGVSQVRVERNMTKEDAYRKAIELAKVNAIENIFGTYVEQQTQITVQSGTSDFYIVGNTKVKGIWVREIDAPRITEDYRDEKGEFGIEKVLWITCRVRGEVKQVMPRPAIEYQVRNCVYPACRTATFLSGEQLYLWFKSPVNGFLSVFIDDGEMVYRLLPYSTMGNENSFEIRGDENYLFFAPEARKGVNTAEKPDEIELYTLKSKEYNTLILVFSTDRYFKPGLNPELVEEKKYLLPKSLTKTRFENWLSEHRAQYDDFLDISIPIEIQNNSK
jgi:hypothetical protein